MLSVKALLVSLLLIAILVQTSFGMAQYFMTSANCENHLTPGTKLMGSNVVTGNSRSVMITRGSFVLASGTSYVPGETLTVILTPTDNQFAFEILTGDATFTGGSCSNKRVANSVASVVMPASGDVQLVAGSASQHGAVAVTETFILKAPTTVGTPSVDQTIGLATVMPTLLAVAPVAVGSRDATDTPTVPPSVMLSSTQSTIQPSIAPTTPLSSVSPSLESTEQPSLSPTDTVATAPSSFPSSVAPVLVTPSVATDLPTVQPSTAAADPSTEPPVKLADISSSPPTAPSVEKATNAPTVDFLSTQPPSMAPLVTSPVPTARVAPISTTTGRPSTRPTATTRRPTLRTTSKPSTSPKVPITMQPTANPTLEASETQLVTVNTNAPSVQAASLIPTSFPLTTASPSTAAPSEEPSLQSVEVVSGPNIVMFETEVPGMQPASNTPIILSSSSTPVTLSPSEAVAGIVADILTFVPVATATSPAEPTVLLVMSGAPIASSLQNTSDVALPLVTNSGSTSTDSQHSRRTVISTLKQRSTQGKLIIGITVTIGSIFILSYAMRYYLRNYRRLLQTDWSFHVASTAILCAGAAMVQTALWARDRPTDSQDANYLGAPRWRENMFAYHPLLMVCGFLGAQVVAICDWSILRSHRVAKCIHILVQTAGLGCLSVGLYVVVDLNLKAKMPALTTLHSWMGIAATSVFTVNYVLGWFMGIMTACYPHSLLRRALDMRRIHRVLGLISLGLSVLAVVSGVMDKLPNGACFYPLPDNPQYSGDLDPAAHYQSIPTSCRLAHGAALSCVVGAVLTVLAVSLRNDPYQRKTDRVSTQGSVVALQLEEVDTNRSFILSREDTTTDNGSIVCSV